MVVYEDRSAVGRPTDGGLVERMGGRWGRRRAATLKVGSTLVVGYGRDMLAAVFGE